MYYIKKWFLRKFYKLLKKTPSDMDMVNWWKSAESTSAIITKNKDGAIIMKMGEGSKREHHDIEMFPRGYLLFGTFKGRPYGPLSVLKHEIKEVFNYAYYLLEENRPDEEVIREIKKKLFEALKITEELKYEMLPPESMHKGVRELWRAMSVLEERYNSRMIKLLKETITFIMSEDDSYRYRVYFLTQIFNPSKWWFKIFFRNPVKDFEIALQELEHAEIVNDMKDRIKLLRMILLFMMKDVKFKQLFLELCKEVDWRKLKYGEIERFHLRAKYFKADFDRFDY